MKKRLIAIMLVLVMAFSCNLGTDLKVSAATALTEDNMTDLVLLIKNRLDIGDEYSKFEYDFYETSSGVTWSFWWSTEDKNKSLYVNCDEKGHISRYNISDYSNRETVPVYTATELLETAKEQLEIINSEIAGSVVFKKSTADIWSTEYEYKFVRVENGIEMPDNYANVRINYVTGELSGYNANWIYDVTIPSADGIMTKEAAAEIIGKKVNMQLAYYLGYDENGNEKAFLAYVPDTGYLAVNAKSGKVYTTKNYWSDDCDDEESFDEASTSNTVSDKNSASLSEAELAKIADLEKLISSEDAIALLKNNKYLLIDENCTYTEAQLYNYNDSEYFWHIYLCDNRPYDWEKDDNYRAYAYATINAETGIIESFNSSVKSYFDFSEEEVQTTKANFTRTQCRKKLEAFIKSVNGERFESTILGSVSRDHIIAYNEKTEKYTYAGFCFSYTRYNCDIPVLNNYISGEVDAVTGKIYSYNYNWSEAELPSPDGIIDEAAAFDAYLSYPGYDLVYEVVNKFVDDATYGSVLKYSVRLVYRTAINPNYVDAFTGKQLDYNGDEYQKKDIVYSYTDIEGSKYQHDIELLAGLGIGFDSDKFEPDKIITEKEFMSLLNNFFYYFGGENEDSDEVKKLTREEAAKILVSSVGYKDIAQLDIYKTGYSDEAKISDGYTGYVALAKGLGLMKAASGNKFKPGTGVTRGEAAQLIVNAISFR